MLALIFLIITASASCPPTITDQLQLLAQPLECFRELYDHKKFDNQKILGIVTERLHSYQRMLQELKMSDQKHLETMPVLKWAQSTSQIFISFKLSHRQDSPTCSDIRKELVRTEEIAEASGDVVLEIVNSGSSNVSSFVYKGECYFTTQRFWFSLNLRFQGILSKLVLRKEGLGLYILIGEKKELGIWGQPFNDYRSAHIWAELRQKYSSDMDKYFELLQQSAENDKAPKRRRKRPKQPTDSEL